VGKIEQGVRGRGVRLEQARSGDAALDTVADVCERAGWRADGGCAAVEEDLKSPAKAGPAALIGAL
jgi:hypothetical protein